MLAPTVDMELLSPACNDRYMPAQLGDRQSNELADRRFPGLVDRFVLFADDRPLTAPGG